LVREQAAEPGFTLIELVVVLAIVALVLALAMPQLGRRPGRLELVSSAHEVAASLRLTRSRAIAENQPRSFVADTRSAAFGPAGQGSLRALPRGIGLLLYTTEDQAVADSIGTIRFFPDGSSTGGGIALVQGELKYQVLVDWLTGGVSINEYPAPLRR
jgi:general secretion pathway protein H